MILIVMETDRSPRVPSERLAGVSSFEYRTEGVSEDWKGVEE